MLIQDAHLTLATPLCEETEISFSFSELFFSRTDRAGIIQFGNSVFQRVSVYTWNELLGKPHKIVRHPDTPRAIFWLLWETLKSGHPIGAYVKNRAKDGSFYWVFAIVTPISCGYLSIRLRPSSPLWQTIKSEYARLARLEGGGSLAPNQSGALLLSRLRELGFADYSAFMATALGAELTARDIALEQPADAALHTFETLQTTAKALLERAEKISLAYVGSENVPFSFRVLAAQLGQAGAAIGIISTNYTSLSDEMREILVDFSAAARGVLATINEAYFLLCTARVQRELVAVFAAEQGTDADRVKEMELLDQQQAAYGDKAKAALSNIAQTAEIFQRSCLEMNRLASGLEVTRVLSVVECARHTEVQHRTTELLGELAAFQRVVSAALKDLDGMNQTIRHDAQRLLRQSR